VCVAGELKTAASTLQPPPQGSYAGNLLRKFVALLGKHEAAVVASQKQPASKTKCRVFLFTIGVFVIKINTQVYARAHVCTRCRQPFAALSGCHFASVCLLVLCVVGFFWFFCYCGIGVLTTRCTIAKVWRGQSPVYENTGRR
jgi:uncharacterized membrane protein YidH (DUF202 family)